MYSHSQRDQLFVGVTEKLLCDLRSVSGGFLGLRDSNKLPAVTKPVFVDGTPEIKLIQLDHQSTTLPSVRTLERLETIPLTFGESQVHNGGACHAVWKSTSLPPIKPFVHRPID